jgi:predicted GNAT family N-acyltransferase
VASEAVYGPEKLTPEHRVNGFDCGTGGLNDYLRDRALSDQTARKSVTYVLTRAGRVVGYYSVAAASIEPESATMRAATGQGRQPIPAILIGRLAVDSLAQGAHVGRALLLDALRKSMAAADIIGARVVLVHASDERARSFYLAHGFEQSPTHALHLMMLMKDIRRTFGAG